MKIDWKKILAVVGGLVILVGLTYLVLWLKPEAEPNGVEVDLKNGSSTVATDISAWKTYRNEKYGFELKVPISWNTTSSESHFTTFQTPFDPNSEFTPGVFITIYKGKTLQEIFNGQSEPQYDFSLDCTTFIFAGTNAYDCSQSFSEVPAHSIILIRNDTVFDIVVDTVSSISEQILSSFKFVEPEVDTSGWEIYRNEKYGFEFKYPSKWNINGTLPKSELLSRLDQGLPANQLLYILGPIEGAHDGIGGNQITVGIALNSQPLSLDEWIIKEIGFEGLDKPITIGGVVGIKRSGISSITDEESVVVMFTTGTVFHTFSATGKENINALNQILATFKFIEP